MTRNTKFVGLLIGLAVPGAIYCAFDIHNAIAYNDLREEICDEWRHADFKKYHTQWAESDWQTCYHIVQTTACWGLNNGKTGPRPPMGCK